MCLLILPQPFLGQGLKFLLDLMLPWEADLFYQWSFQNSNPNLLNRPHVSPQFFAGLVGRFGNTFSMTQTNISTLEKRKSKCIMV